MLNKYTSYATGLNAREEVLLWINSVLKNYLKKSPDNQTEVEHILDYLMSSSAPTRLLKMSYKEAKSNTEKWNAALQKKGRDIVEGPEDLEQIHLFNDNSRIVKLLSKKAYQREGHLMRHCLGGYDVNSSVEIYSLRDSKNLPHCTFEVLKDDEQINQIKGKGNGSIHPKYIEKVLKFLQLLDQDIRPSEMKNLGYYNIHPDLVGFAQKVKSDSDILTEIGGHHYVYYVS